VRSRRSSASPASKPGLNRREAGSAHAGPCSGLSRIRGNSHVRFWEGVAATPLPYPTTKFSKFAPARISSMFHPFVASAVISASAMCSAEIAKHYKWLLLFIFTTVCSFKLTLHLLMKCQPL
jgi:hypothetical protein